jgi:adenylyltransferase/sulfurtransferase
MYFVNTNTNLLGADDRRKYYVKRISKLAFVPIMTAIPEHVAELRAKISSVEEQLRALKAELEVAVAESTVPVTRESLNEQPVRTSIDEGHIPAADPTDAQWPLSSEEFQRYGRAMIMREIGLPGQLALKHAKVLIVGVGGLGCPAAAYLAGAGVGTLGLMDGDVVEASNLHRQIAHTTERIGMHKVDSAKTYLEAYVVRNSNKSFFDIHKAIERC